ncbi:MAG TPA: short-chain fatty acyl-CoA regulator family protein [Candidatus Eisenbacteria bacterium]|nr:short-chain fatty acyl-CoA regulator family protein [Candidatus Eisenbacteria bacterium]
MGRETTTGLGKRVRALRLREGLTQSAMAARLGISPSYLNLIESDRRPLSANLLLALAQAFSLDLRSFAGSVDTKLVADLSEVFGDPLFEDRAPSQRELGEFVAGNPEVARAVIHLHHAYTEARASAESIAAEVVDRQDLSGVDRAGLAAEEVSDLIQRHVNHFPELEAEAERVGADAKLHEHDFFEGMALYLERKHRVRVRVLRMAEMKEAVRRFDPERLELCLSEVLRRGSRNFQLAHQVALLTCPDTLDRIASDSTLTSAESRALCRVALANYFAGALLMPYEAFYRAAEEERYDTDLLEHRFRANFEQICHRLTTLNRAGMRGIPFHMVRVDIAGNISKKFSATGLRFPRFGGLCPLWNVHAAFLQPNVIRAQLDRLPDGTMYFSIARTIRKHRGGYRTPEVMYSVGLGCDVESARRMVYADGFDLANPAGAAPVGITCRLCERLDCRARAFPSIYQPLRVDENARGVSFFTRPGKE